MSEVNETRVNAEPEISTFEVIYTISSELEIATNHGFASAPRQVATFLQCIATEHGYAVGDLVPLYLNGVANSGTIWVNKTDLNVKFADLPKICDTDGVPQSITAAKWNLVIRCEI